MPSVGAKVHELRIIDETTTWRIVYAIAVDAIVILEVFSKKTQQTPESVIDVCQRRLKRYLAAIAEE